MPGISVDGNDVVKVYEAARDAIAGARAGRGPTLIECRTYRVGFHNTSDNPNDYRTHEEVAEAVTKDPIDRLRRYALRAGIITDEGVEALSAEISEMLDVARQKVDAFPRPAADAIYEHVYSDPPVRMQRQRDEALGC